MNATATPATLTITSAAGVVVVYATKQGKILATAANRSASTARVGEVASVTLAPPF